MDRPGDLPKTFINILKTASPLFLIVAALASCSGGGSGSGSSVAATNLSGAVIDAPVTGAAITITENAPLGQQGALTLGTATADQYGKYSLSGIAIPKTSAPIYANSQGGSVNGTENPDILLTAYLGQGQALAAAGSDLAEGNDPDLAVSQVTTAAVALASNGGKNYQISGYQATLTSDQTQLIELSSEIMCQVDAGTALPSGENTLSFVNGLVAQNAPGPTTDYLTVSGAITCSDLTTYMNMLTASADWDAELTGGDTPVSSLNIPAGTYSLEGLIEGTGISASSTTTSSTPSITPFTISLSVAADGSVSTPSNASNTLSISSGSNISGQLLKLILTDGSGDTYTLNGTLKLLPATWHTAPTQAFVFQGGGTDSNGSTNTMTNVNAVLSSGNDSPTWSSFAPIDGQEKITCNNGGFKLRATLPSSGSVPVFPVCLADTNSTTLSLTNISNSQGEGENHDESNQNNPPSTISATLTTQTNTPFIASGPLTIGTGSGSAANTMFYVLGANGAFVTSYGSSSSPSSSTCTLSASCVSGDTAGSIYFSGNIIPLPQNDH